MKKIFNIQTVVMLIVLVMPALAHAQIPLPASDPDAVAAPIDGGLSILIASGVGYGIKRARDKRKNAEKISSQDDIK